MLPTSSVIPTGILFCNILRSLHVYSILLVVISVGVIVVALQGSKELLRLGCCLPLASLLTEDLWHIWVTWKIRLMHYLPTWVDDVQTIFFDLLQADSSGQKRQILPTRGSNSNKQFGTVRNLFITSWFKLFTVQKEISTALWVVLFSSECYQSKLI